MDSQEPYFIRRSEDSDQNGVLELDAPSKDARRVYFGRALLGAVIETSFLSLTATDPTRPDRMLGFAAFDSSPPGELADAACYPAFLEHKFDLPPTAACIFLTYFAQRQTASGAASRPPVLRHLLYTLFASRVKKRCVLLILPDDVNITETEPTLAKFFERVPTRSSPLEAPKGSLAVQLERKRLEQQFAKHAQGFSRFIVYQAKADAFFPAVHVRRARVEDHDDLDPILTAQAESVSSAFGEYFLAELIHDQDEHNVCLIAEAAGTSSSLDVTNGNTGATSQGRAVGLLAISDQLDVSTLQENFALGPLNDLAKRFCSDTVISLEVPDDEVVRRIAGRRVDPETGKTYHLEFNPPPQNDEELLARLVQRSDDTESTIHHRLSTFHKHLGSVLSVFTAALGSGATVAKIVSVNGLQSKHVVAQQIIEQIRAIKTAQKLRVLVKRGDLTPPKLVISGPPAGGKGTQCEQLVALLGVVHLSTGDILRQAIRDKSPLGTQAQSYMDEGQLVPDELIVNVVLERIAQPDCESQGWLLDGFPRTATQAEALLAARGGKAVPDCVLVLGVPDEEVIRRIAGRRVDPETGKTYHVEFNPPPSEVQARVIQRSDDTEETLRTRLEQFHAHSDGVLAAFESYHGDQSTTVQIIRADGLQPALLIAQAFLAPSFQRVAEAEAQVLQQTGAQSLVTLTKAEAHTNCFAVTLFCVGDDVFERASSADLLVAAFATFPTRDYCLLTLPTQAREPSCLAFFSPVTARPASAFTHALYVLHRDAISFFCPRMSDGRSVLRPVQLLIHRLMPSGGSPADDAAELSPLMVGLDRQTLRALDEELAFAYEEADIDLEDSPKHVAFVVRANGQIVGLAALARQPDVASLPNYFDMDRVARMAFHRAKDQAIVRHLILNPIFAACSRFVLLELMRHFRKTCLIYQVPTGLGPNSLNRPTQTSFSAALQEFFLAPPRRGVRSGSGQPVRPGTRDTPPDGEEGDDVKVERERVRRAAVCAAFALFILPKRLLSEPKLTINQRVVLVGASDAALGCLVRLLATPYLRFANLTLISPHGLILAPMDDSESDATQLPRASDFARKSTFTAVELEQFSLRTHISVIEGRMVRIDREAKAVILQDGSCLPYDYLALTAGLQDGTCTSLGRLPRFTDEDMNGIGGSVMAAVYCPPIVPRQMLALGDFPTAQRLHKELLQIMHTTPRIEEEDHEHDQPGGSIVVYGSSLLALQVIQALLARGISGSRILHVSPARDSGIGVFEDAVVRTEMEKQYLTNNITLHTAMKIISIETTPGNDDELEGVRVISTLDTARGSDNKKLQLQSICDPDEEEGNMVEGELLPCEWLLCCQHNDADPDVFRAVNESGLVYDGRLVVDGRMRTTDAHVLAAGTLSRFSRRFIASKLHENYSSREGGELLARSLLRLLDPLSVPDANEVAQPVNNAHSSKAPMVPPPEMELPVVRCAVVPGGKHYVQISIPALTNTLALQILPTNTATRIADVSLIGGDTDEMEISGPSRPATAASSSGRPTRYTCLLFDDVGVLNRLEYLGDGAVPVRDLQNLVGLHEAYLNSALASFAAGKVHDWIAFFAHPWTSALYHDRFPAFRAKLRTLLAKDDGYELVPRMLLKVIRAEALPSADMNGKSDPFVKVWYDGKEVASSPRVKRSLNPRWDFEVTITLVHAGVLDVELEILDRDEISANDLLVKGTAAQGRVLCSVQYEERDLKYLVNHPYGTSIQEVFLPQNPRFERAYCHLPRSWHPDAAVRQDELSALQAGTPKDTIFPWHEKLLHMVEEVTVTFHVNESNQGVLATLVLTNYRIWFVPYRRVRGLLHEDVHTLPISKILKASIQQQKRSNNVITVLTLDNMDAGHYHVTLSPISRLRDSVRDFSREAELKRVKTLHNIVREIEWLRIENSFCSPSDRNHTVADADELQLEDDLRLYTPKHSSSSMPPPMARALTASYSKYQKHTFTKETIGRMTLNSSGGPMERPKFKQQLSESAAHTTTLTQTTSMRKPPQHFQLAARRRIRYDPEVEFRRQGALVHPRWRQCDLNEQYQLCSTYPAFLVVPECLNDEIIKAAATFRSKSRFPALTWIHPRTGAPLCRSSQPNTGVLRSTSPEDKKLIWAIRDAAIPAEQASGRPRNYAMPKKNSILHIVDARPEINAKSNALAGKGHESVKQYDRDGVATAAITFMGIDNIHVVRNSLAGLAQALYEVEDSNFFGSVQKSRWLEHVCSILQGASEVATHLERGDAVLVHCSDGWDRTAQLSALAQMMLDPYYRTLEGFAILIEKEWCSFGHMFQKRCGHSTSDQTSPIFLQFIDAVYQLTLQFPTHFQYNELLLSSVAEAVYSSWYGTFQKNSECERRLFLSNVASVSVWDVIRASTDQYLNPLFTGGETRSTRSKGGSFMEPVLPVCRVRVMQLWVSQYQKAIGHMRLQQREFEMLQLIRQQETDLSRLYAALTSEQLLELRAGCLRSDIAKLSRSMNLKYPDDPGTPSKGKDGRLLSDAPHRGSGKRPTAASLDFHDLASIVAMGSSPLLTTDKVISAGNYLNSQPVWERDEDAPCCKRCKKKFKALLRNRHHCRCCGYVFCGRCTSHRMSLPDFGYYDVVRVCKVCYNSGEDG
ncbi:hypothetical protein JM18_005971 [Phytophthora kernoviae]|uniref:phosphatidylinositol-3,5-bisphosphate 3-phosphatase n=1 Tax=Phytophthora kernoviae TaxID=325452 RepID=A0A921SFG7_9STRA|nr:hypothetical protein JM18_005971 [Phytophthora kernoviae]